MGELLQNAFPSRDNVVNLTVYHVDDSGVESALDMTLVTRVTVILYGALSGANVTLDSNAGVNISWDSSGNIVIPFNGQTIDDGQFNAAVVLYDPGHLNGQYIAHPDSNSRLYIRVTNDS